MHLPFFIKNDQRKRTKTKKAPNGALLQFGAGNEVRTRDPNHGKVMLYQLSYARIRWR